LRKLLMGAVVASASLAVATGAIAQAPAEGTFTAAATPKNAGTAKKPTNTKLSFSTSVTTENATADKIVIKLPPQLKLSGKGFRRCTVRDDLPDLGRSLCPSASKAGPKGVANALTGIASDPNKTPLTLDVFPYVQDRNTFLFFLKDRNSDYTNYVKGEITRRGSTISIVLHEGVREPVEGIPASLVSIAQTFGGKRNGRYIVSSVGCKRNKWRIAATISFATRPDGYPPPGTMSKTATAGCTK
jgi:hypothetical protein